MGGKLLTVHEVAAYLDISVNTLRKWRAKNYGPVGRPMGKHIRYLPEDVEAWVKAQGEA
nr:helix-turn-helix domain-containing protein [Amycolatopsis saalfeldensis]